MLRGTTSNVPLFGNPKRRKQKQQKEQEQKDQEEKLRQQALEEAEFATKAETSDFLLYYLERSPFKDQCDQISIAWENLPSLGELESYAKLNKTSGTQACRRLFKAVVIWDDLGLDLWETLNSTLKPSSDEEESDDDLLDEICEEPIGWDTASTRRSRSPASSKSSSSETFVSERSRQVSADSHSQRERSRDSRKTVSTRDQSTNGRAPPRRPMGLQGGMISEYYDSPSRYRVPKIVRVL
ncbi:Ff.00g028000.m01.CDS01 [Fusarium sp. VM40]|nr:Ff.00g028000.m01.CDS01 [Fusarium sp. VM40]